MFGMTVYGSSTIRGSQGPAAQRCPHSADLCDYRMQPQVDTYPDNSAPIYRWKNLTLCRPYPPQEVRSLGNIPQRSRTLGLSALAVAAVGDSSNFSAAGYSLRGASDVRFSGPSGCSSVCTVVSIYRCARSITLSQQAAYNPQVTPLPLIELRSRNPSRITGRSCMNQLAVTWRSSGHWLIDWWDTGCGKIARANRHSWAT